LYVRAQLLLKSDQTVAMAFLGPHMESSMEEYPHEKNNSIKGTLTNAISEVVPVVPGYEYLTGVRGLLTIQCFLWVFLTTFVPAAVKNSGNTAGPGYQIFLRKILSVVFWNGGLSKSGA
jgi:hypothetical protein